MRRQIRLWIVAWLLFQCASVSALAVRDCCCKPEGAKATHCQKQTPAEYCPMQATGAPCPMHQEAQRDDCTVRGTCGGPMSAVAVLFATWGIAADSFTLVPDPAIRPAVSMPNPGLIDGCLPVDIPPPRG